MAKKDPLIDGDGPSAEEKAAEEAAALAAAEEAAAKAEKDDKKKKTKEVVETNEVENIMDSKNPMRIAGEIIEFGKTFKLTAEHKKDKDLMMKIRHQVVVGTLKWA